jgi:hypothetical protein
MISVSVSGRNGTWALDGGTILSRLWIPRLLIHVLTLFALFGGPTRPGVSGVFGIRTIDAYLFRQSLVNSYA